MEVGENELVRLKLLQQVGLKRARARGKRKCEISRRRQSIIRRRGTHSIPAAEGLLVVVLLGDLATLLL